MKCAGSVGEDGEATVHAATGTYAHSIAAQCLQDTSVSPEDFLLKREKVDGFDIECDQEMVDGVRLYLEACDDDMQEGDIIWVEMSLHDALQSVDKDCGGTADYVRYRPSTRNLLVTDLKYGAGIYVEVVDNTQLRTYALGTLLEVLRKYGHKVDTVTSRIVQPRYEGAEPIREETFKAVALLDFAADIQDAAEPTRLPNPPLVAGPHCQHFCPKAHSCPELTKKKQVIMTTELPAALTATAEFVAALAEVPLVKAQIKALEERAYKLAVQGVEIPGRKLVQKEARRKWRSEGAVIMWAQEKGLDPYAPREILSPAQFEAKIKETLPRGQKKTAGSVVEPFVERISSGTVLVPLSDDRPAVSARITAASFTAVPAAKSALSLF